MTILTDCHSFAFFRYHNPFPLFLSLEIFDFIDVVDYKLGVCFAVQFTYSFAANRFSNVFLESLAIIAAFVIVSTQYILFCILQNLQNTDSLYLALYHKGHTSGLFLHNTFSTFYVWLIYAFCDGFQADIFHDVSKVAELSKITCDRVVIADSR